MECFSEERRENRDPKRDAMEATDLSCRRHLVLGGGGDGFTCCGVLRDADEGGAFRLQFRTLGLVIADRRSNGILSQH